jgi:hypothetical protein
MTAGDGLNGGSPEVDLGVYPRLGAADDIRPEMPIATAALAALVLPFWAR